MELEEARQLLEAQDTTDLDKALVALATVLRFHGISDARLVRIAEDIEGVAADRRQPRSAAMNDELPPLPPPIDYGFRDEGGTWNQQHAFAADQMRAYARTVRDAAIAAERERCIEIVAMSGGSVEIEAAIRQGWDPRAAAIRGAK